MMTLIGHLIADLCVPLVARTFFRAIKRWPGLLAAIALTGEAVGVWAVACWPAGDWRLVGIGVLCLGFYTFLLALLAIKLRAGTWGAFCDWAASEFDPHSQAEPSPAPDPGPMEPS